MFVVILIQIYLKPTKDRPLTPSPQGTQSVIFILSVTDVTFHFTYALETVVTEDKTTVDSEASVKGWLIL